MTLEAYTEKAISVLGGAMPHIAYLPPSLRTRPMPDSMSDGTLSDDQLTGIVEADPVGFLIAVMNGKLLVRFRVEPAEKDTASPIDDKPKRGRPSTKPQPMSAQVGEENGRAIYAEYHTPSIADRMRVAMYLATKVLTRGANAEPPEPTGIRDQEMVARFLARIEVEKNAASASADFADTKPQ